MVRPIIKWLTDRGVQYVEKTRVTDIDIGNDTDGEITAREITMVQDGKQKKVEVRPEDIVIADAGLDGRECLIWHERFPTEADHVADSMSGKWALWETLAKKRKDIFRDPSVFTGHVDESSFTSFTVTQTDRCSLI